MEHRGRWTPISTALRLLLESAGFAGMQWNSQGIFPEVSQWIINLQPLPIAPLLRLVRLGIAEQYGLNAANER